MQLIITISSGNSLNDGKPTRCECQYNTDRNTRPNQEAREKVLPTSLWLSKPNATDANEQHRTKQTVAESVQPNWQIAVVNHGRVRVAELLVAL